MLDACQIERYRSDGFLTGIPVMTREKACIYRDSFDELEAEKGREVSHNELTDAHLDHQFVWEIGTHPWVLECVTDLIGPDVLLLGSHFFCKYGPEQKFVAWHQDLRYWGLEPLLSVSVWYAVDDSDLENGCLRVIPGTSQRLLEHGKSRREGNLLSVDQELQVDPEEEAGAVDLVLRAGQISIHDGLAIHGSRPNRSKRRRCGLALSYIPTGVGPTSPGPIGTDLKWRPILVRGRDREGNFPSIQEPPFPLATPEWISEDPHNS